MEKLIERLLVALPAAFTSDDYRRQISEMREDYQAREDELFSKLGKRARELGLNLVRTPGGYSIGPMKDGKLLSAAEFNALPEEEQAAIKKEIDLVHKDVHESVQVVSAWQEESVE